MSTFSFAAICTAVLVLRVCPGQATTELHVETHQSATISCDVDEPLLVCSVHGPHGQAFEVQQDVPIAPPEGYRQVGRMNQGKCGVQIEQVSEKDNGNWSCMATPLGKLRIETTIQLHVYTPVDRPGEWYDVTDHVFSTAGSSATILCRITSPLFLCTLTGPDGQLVRIQDDAIVGSPEGFAQVGSNREGYCGVRIEAVEEKDGGIWTCQLVPVGKLEVETTMQLHVL